MSLEALALLVLVAIPLAILTIVIVGAVLIVFVARRFGSGRGQFAAGLLTVFIIALIPTWDVIIGRIEFHRLCAAKGGLRIYKQVRLDPKFGDVQFPELPLAYRETSVGARYPERTEEVADLPGPGTIKMIRRTVSDSRTGDVLGTSTVYNWGGGWFEQALTTAPGAGGGYCGHESGDFPELLKRIFPGSQQSIR
jgi:hypothetical protein